MEPIEVFEILLIGVVIGVVFTIITLMVQIPDPMNTADVAGQFCQAKGLTLAKFEKADYNHFAWIDCVKPTLEKPTEHTFEWRL